MWFYSLTVIKVIYLLHFVPRLFGVTIFFGYDTKCAINENASIFNCTQDFFVARPKEWIMYWLVSPTLSSFCLYFICGAHKQVKIRKTCSNVAFWSIMILSFITSASFLVQIHNTDPEDMALSFALFMWWPSTIWQIFYLDNLVPVTYPRSKPLWHSCNGKSTNYNGGKPCYHKKKFANILWLYLVYKLSLITHCIECFAFASAATLDATLVLPVTDKLPVGVAKIFLGIRVVLVYGICFLYLQKILHGDRTLFATPGESLQPVRRGGKETEV